MSKLLPALPRCRRACLVSHLALCGCEVENDSAEDRVTVQYDEARIKESAANLLRRRIAKGGVDCWLVNTGWTGGQYGTGTRMPIKVTRALLSAALSGKLKQTEFRTDTNFGFEVPVEVEGVDAKILDPRATWADGHEYDQAARGLADRFRRNFTQFVAHVDESIRAAAPHGIFDA